MNRIFNFSAGPCTLPLPALERAKAEFVDYQGAGMSLIEMSHRGKQYDAVHHEALSLLRELLAVPESHEILFLQGGATLQFAMIPMNLRAPGQFVELVNTGVWAKKALADAEKLGETRVIWSGADTHFDRAPAMSELSVSPDAAYVHLTTNETIGGVEFLDAPETTAPVVADMSSHIMSRAVDFTKFDLIYAGAQKNLGPAGCAVVIIEKGLLGRCQPGLPAYLSYQTHAPKASMYNTPPVFAIYMMMQTLRWVRDEGGLPAMDALAEARSKAVYDAIEASDGWYRCPVQPGSRSRMNVPFRLPTEALEKKFIAEALEAGLSGLKGHRSVGGCRASMYNAMPVAGAEALAQFMAGFKTRNG